MGTASLNALDTDFQKGSRDDNAAAPKYDNAVADTMEASFAWDRRPTTARGDRGSRRRRIFTPDVDGRGRHPRSP